MSAPADEARAVELVVDRLAERFPAVTRDHIRVVVDEEVRRLDGGKVRDFIPVLAEHAARDRLRALARPA